MFPACDEAEFGGGSIKHGAIDVGCGHGDHAADVAEMFIAAAFLEKMELPENHVLGRGKVNGMTFDVCQPTVIPGPLPIRVACGGVDVGFKTGGEVNDIEMAAYGATDFNADNLDRRRVIIGFGENLREVRDLRFVQMRDQIDIHGQPGFTVLHRGERA